ncbi:MAG: recombinase family protein [Planctomycetota bacterium]|jgi:site-specific DNA recombinase
MCNRNAKILKNDDFRVAIYARVSSDQQAQAGTIASQIEALRERLAKENLRLEQELSFIDDGYTGATFVRPGLERLRDTAAAGAIDRVYVHSPDRLARKYAYQVLLVDELERCGVEVVFLNRQIGQSPEDDLLLQVQGMIAEYERAKILERSRRGKLHAARQGSVNVLSGAPYGYRYVSCQEGAGQASYEIVLEQARVVRQIFEWVGQDRLSIGEVRRRLQKQGIPTKTGKAYWDRTTVWGVLKNPAYKGMAAYGKTRTGPMKPRLRTQRGDPDQPRRPHSTSAVPIDQWHYIPVPAIVSEALFDSVQEQLAENKKRHRQRKRGASYLLQGLLVCKKCGYAYYGKPVSNSAAKGKKRSYAYYRCIGSDAYRFGGQRICCNKQVRTDMLEQSVWEDVCSLLRNPQRIEQEYKRRLTGKKKSVRWNSIDQLRVLIKKVKRGIARLVDAYQDGLIDKSEFEPRMRKAKDRLAKLQAEANEQTDRQAQQKELRLVIGHLQAFADKVNSNLKELDWMRRREIIRALVKQIEVDQEIVRVVYRVTPPPFVQAPEKGFLQYCLRGEVSTLWSPLLGLDPVAFFHIPRFQKAAYQQQKTWIFDTDSQHLQQPVV